MGIGNSPMPIIGTFETIIRFKSGYVKNIVFHVIDAHIPPLLGLNFLNHDSIKSYFITKTSIILTRKINDTFFKNKIFFEDPRVFCSTVSNIDQNIEIKEDLIKEVYASKMKKAKDLLGVEINENADLNQAEKIADLLLHFKDVFGVNSDDKLGTFPKEVSILTKGKPIYVKQHPISQQYQKDVEIEILKMLK